MSSTRDRIIEATLQLVAEEGLAGVTMVAVAKAAGVARATLYNHYTDVPSVLADAARVHNEHAIAGLRQAMAVVSGPSQGIEQLVRYVASISMHGHSLSTHHHFPPELRNQLGAFDLELAQQLETTLVGGVASGEFRPALDIDTTATLLLHALVGVSELVAATPDRAAPIADSAIATLLAAIGADPKDRS
ncbi:MAG: TetR/AcrR family transcriptional regulator [Acidimicrobiales bacterium]